MSVESSPMNSPRQPRIVAFFLKVTVALVSIILTVAAILVGFNFYLSKFWSVNEYSLLLWRLELADFSPEYVFWGKNHCDLYPDYCNFPEEKILPQRIVKYGDCDNDPEPLNVVFVGDSFTVGPWLVDEDVYSSTFSKHLSETTNHCVASMRLATHATGTQQQYARFLDTVEQLHPDLVIWQLYYNDTFDDEEYNLFDIQNGQLVRHKLWLHPIIWAGKLNQLHPFIPTTSLGKYILYVGQTKDLFRVKKSWDGEVHTETEKILDSIDQLASRYHFQWFTTLAPLECELTDIQCDENTKRQESLRKILLKRDNFLSMYEPSLLASSTASVAGITTDHDSWFNRVEDPAPPGNRHLSKEGNQMTGEILFQNYELTATKSATVSGEAK